MSATGLAGLAALVAASPSPSPSDPAATLDPDLVTPGLWGFASLFVLALAVYLIGRGMARRVQRVNQRARVEAEERAREERARAAARGEEPGPDAHDGPGDAPRP
ncbi:hypothetical protein [Kineococcus sp. SYSU DK004]|uniref:hypothetical protein n=1 Tax=Kineococcus sp. SYSU DK004 TaxID=3383125 RepID=UPI003D7D2318